MLEDEEDTREDSGEVLRICSGWDGRRAVGCNQVLKIRRKDPNGCGQDSLRNYCPCSVSEEKLKYEQEKRITIRSTYIFQHSNPNLQLEQEWSYICVHSAEFAKLQISSVVGFVFRDESVCVVVNSLGLCSLVPNSITPVFSLYL